MSTGNALFPPPLLSFAISDVPAPVTFSRADGAWLGSPPGSPPSKNPRSSACEYVAGVLDICSSGFDIRPCTSVTVVTSGKS